MQSKDPYLNSKLNIYRQMIAKKVQPNFLERMCKDKDQRSFVQRVVNDEIGLEDVKSKARL